jgi:hypothetical protein
LLTMLWRDLPKPDALHRCNPIFKHSFLRRFVLRHRSTYFAQLLLIYTFNHYMYTLWCCSCSRTRTPTWTYASVDVYLSQSARRSTILQFCSDKHA